MKPVEKSFNKAGYTFSEVYREGNLAIYSQTKRGEETPIAWEVVRIKVRDPKAFLEETEPVEVYPPNERWGLDGWTLFSLASAHAKLAWFRSHADTKEPQA